PGEYFGNIFVFTPLRLTSVEQGAAKIVSGFAGIAIIANDVRVEGFAVTEAAGAGIIVFGSNNADIRNNRIYGNGFDDSPGPDNSFGGIVVIDSQGGSITNNQVYENGSGEVGQGGILLYDSAGYKVQRNNSSDNFGSGILLSNSDSSKISDNTTDTNAIDGIDLCQDSGKNLLERNDADANGEDGIYVDDSSFCGDLPSSDNSIKRNVLTNHTFLPDALDVTVGSGTVGTANTWNDNTCDTDFPDGLCEFAAGAQPVSGDPAARSARPAKIGNPAQPLESLPQPAR
ncbi:MAG: right-handed parallel beta-helix repeat-containing protein, partial [Chloroflexales bacterium]|nr:right-handed parallel beta-helix repeat-containing protein [Chloroflexales bacterium]